MAACNLFNEVAPWLWLPATWFVDMVWCACWHPCISLLQGCGIVRFSSHAAARLAKEQLHGQRKFNEDGPAMVVEWVNEGKLRVADKAGGCMACGGGGSNLACSNASGARAPVLCQVER